MEWTPGGDSSDLEDRRGEGAGGGGFGFGGGGIGGGGIGIVGFLVLLVISLVTGHNFLGSLLGGGGGGGGNMPMQGQEDSGGRYSSANTPTTPGGQPKDRDTQLMLFTLNDVQKFWQGYFGQIGKPYQHAKLVVFSGSTYSGCGGAQAATGPFYCPGDGKVYIDESFWNELKQFGGSTADFAQAYVIAHEMGHHVQDELGTERKVTSLMRSEPGEKNHLSVDLELQADCYGGVWAHHAQEAHITDPGDVDSALSAVAAVGDDHLEKMSGRAVSPESWTHGSSAQRQQWFKTGFTTGDPQQCNTFGGSQ